MTDISTSHLPPSTRLPVDVLARLFQQRTNSYKYVFFLSLLDEIETSIANDRGSLVFSMASVGAGMLVTAWYPYYLHRLAFGGQDKVVDTLETFPAPEAVARDARQGRSGALRAFFLSSGAAIPLLRYVPHRLIRPFFAAELAGEADYLVNRRVVDLANDHFATRRPLYRFTESGEELVVHPEWFAYFSDHLSILRDWALWHWLDYMRRRNPSAVSLSTKLLPQPRRMPLTQQREFWRVAMEWWPGPRPVACPYSGVGLKSREFALDHFIPWAFVAHDRLWNLVPTVPALNGAKSDRLPDGKYLSAAAELHATALRATWEAAEQGRMSETQWMHRVEQYVLDLHIGRYEDLLNSHRVVEAYQDQLSPLLELARAQGFEAGWVAPAIGS